MAQPGYVAPTPTQGKRCWLLVWPGVPPADGFHAPGAHWLYLPVNPDLQLTRAIRTTPTQTIQGTWVDNFGLGIGTLTLSGHTGWASAGGSYNGQPVNGAQAFDHLWYDIVEYYFALQSQQATTTPQVTMQFGNDMDGWYFDVLPTSSPQPFSEMRSKTQPLLEQFTLSLLVLRDNRHPGAVSPLADPIDPLIQTAPATAPRGAIGPTPPTPGHTPTPSPVHTALPARSQVVTVTAGQTVWGIAQAYLSPPQTAARTAAAVQAIAQANQLANPNLIYVGQTLTIPTPLP